MKKSLALLSAVAVLGLSACSNAEEEAVDQEPTFSKAAEADTEDTVEESAEDNPPEEEDASADDDAPEETTEVAAESDEPEFREVEGSHFSVGENMSMFWVGEQPYNCFTKGHGVYATCFLPLKDGPEVYSPEMGTGQDYNPANAIALNSGKFEYVATPIGVPRGGVEGPPEAEFIEPGTKSLVIATEFSYSKDGVLRGKHGNSEFVLYPDGTSEIN